MPTRAERLADHYIACAGIAAVYVDACGGIAAAFRVGIFRPFGCVVLCCPPGRQIDVAANAAARVRHDAGQRAALAAVVAAASELRVRLTPHANVVARAFEAVSAVRQTFADMQQSGGLKELNADFRIARAANPSLRYQDYLHEQIAKSLAALAMEK